MGKELVPRFKCPLCGWLAYYSMLNEGPHRLEVVGMKYSGFQKISYHKIWGSKKEYREFLRLKVLELAKMLGLKLTGKVDETEEVTDEYEEEVETEPSEEVRVEKPSRQVKKPSGREEIPVGRIATVPVEAQQSVRAAYSGKALKAFHKAFHRVENGYENGYVATADAEDVRTIDHEFIERGE